MWHTRHAAYMSFSTACLTICKACCHSLVENCVNKRLCCVSEIWHKVIKMLLKEWFAFSQITEKLQFVNDIMASPVYQFIICILIKGIIKPVKKEQNSVFINKNIILLWNTIKMVWVETTNCIVLGKVNALLQSNENALL